MATLPHGAPPLARQTDIERVVCGVDGSPRGEQAVREAIALAAAAPQLTFVAVSATANPSAAVASLDERRALRALEQAQALAAESGVRAATQFVRADDVAGALIGCAGPRGLIVAGGPGGSPLVHAAAGSVADALLHRATGPLLIGRPVPEVADDAPHILVAVDDTAAAPGVAGLAGTLAAATRGHVHLVHVAGPGYGRATRHRLAELSIDLIAMTGAEPVVDVLHAHHVAACVAQFAQRTQASLVVVGRRGVTGLHALGAVSERVVRTAPCSVLVVPAAHPA